MPFNLKRIDNIDNDESPFPQYYSGTIRIGSGKDCDLIINSDKILPFHCEIYHRGTEFRFVAAQSAFAEVNDTEVLKWPVILTDGDILTIGNIKFQFNTIQSITRRSWRASFASSLAVILLVALILFEIIIMVWLPYTLNKNKTWELATAKQYVIRQIDLLRNKTNSMPVAGRDETVAKKLLQACENSIAGYLRKYSNAMNREQTRTVHRDLYKLENIVDQWPYYKKLYATQETINPDIYINRLCSDLLEQSSKHNQ